MWPDHVVPCSTRARLATSCRLARTCDENANSAHLAPRPRGSNHRCRTADRCLTFSTIFGRAPMSASTVLQRVLLAERESQCRDAQDPAALPSPSARAMARPPRSSRRSQRAGDPREIEVHQEASLSVPGIDTLVTWGARGPCAALITASGTTASTRRSSSSVNASREPANAACSRAASSAAVPSPRSPARSRCPGRHPELLTPAWMNGFHPRGDPRTTSARMPSGPRSCGRRCQKRARDVHATTRGILPKACTPSTVERDASLAHRAASRPNGLHHADLVVHPHPRLPPPRPAAPQRLAQRVLRHLPLAGHRGEMNLLSPSEPRVRRARTACARWPTPRRGRDRPLACRQRASDHRQVVRLRPTGREDHLARLDGPTERRGNAALRLLPRRHRAARPKRCWRRGSRRRPAQIGQHRLEHLRAPGRGRVVEIDSRLGMRGNLEPRGLHAKLHHVVRRRASRSRRTAPRTPSGSASHSARWTRTARRDPARWVDFPAALAPSNWEGVQRSPSS